MDYDENDFQSQNQHLAGEGNAKFSPALQPYALSKFDFDDNLQGNLRFDSLVESEVFLGIANNVDNHWIEDFSRGNSGIEFSTCATVPCSIARHNNVWSEATSSESVEMLLKSVGQEETTLNRTTIGAADACNPATSTKEMEPNLTHDDSVFSNSEETVKPQLALVPDETLQNYSSIKEAMVDEPSQVEVASRTHSESFVGGMSVDVDPSALDGNSGAFKAEGSSPNNDKSDDKIPGEVHNLLAKPSNYSAEEAGSSLDVQGDNVVKVTDHITMSCNRVESQIALDQVNVAVENVDGLQTDIDVQGGEILAVSMEERRNSEISADNAAEISTSHLRCNANLSLKGQYKEEGNAVEAGVSTDQEPSTPGPQVMEGCSGDTSRIISVQASISEDNISAKDAGTVEQLEAEGKKVAVSVEPAVTGSEQSMDSNQQKTIMQTDTIDQKDDKSDCNEQQAKGSASLLLQVDDDKVLEKDGEGINSVSGHMTVGSLPRQHEETQASDSSKDADGRMGQQNVSGEKCSQSSSSVEIKQVERENEPGSFSLSSEDNDRKDIHHHKKTLKSSGQELESMTIVNLEECEILTHADASCGTAEQQSSETVSQVKPVSDAGNTDILDASQATVLTVVNHETEKEPKASPDFCEPMVNKSDHIEMVPEKHGDTIAEEKFEKDLKDSENVLKASESFPKSSPSTECHERSRAQEEEIDNADSSKAECSSPIVISSSELSQEVNIEGADKNSSHQNVPSSDVKDSHVLVDQKGMDAAKDERSFTFDVSPLMRTEGSQKWQQFPALKDSKLSPIVEGSPLTPALVQVENKVLQPNATGSPRKSRDAVRGHLKDTPERKTRRTSSKAAGKESAKKGISAKATAALKKSEAGASSYRSLSPSGIYQVVQSNEMQHFGQVDGTNAKPFGVLNTAASSLPDLNTSALGNVVFQQPFTDLQQVQLRAQIFVYGSLISKVAPEEAHMLSAFGGPDGGRSMWENALRKCRERILGQTVHPASIETPSQSRLASDQATKQNIVPNKATPSPVGRGTSKSTPSPATNPLLPLSSPLWNISTPSFEALQSLPKGAGRDYQAFSPVHLNQTPPLGNYFGHSTTWMSQTPFRASWSASQNSVLDPSVRFPSLPMNEAVKLVPVKESPVSLSSAMKNVAPGPVKKDAVQASVLPGSSVASLDAKKETVSPGQPSTDPKSRKRKKALNSGDLGQITTQSHSLVHPGSLAALTGHQSAPVPAASSTGFLSEASMGKHNMSVPSPIPPGNSKAVEQDKKSVLPEESIIKVEEARQQAEDAAAFAAAAIGHSQEIWNQLNKQKDSGLRAAAEVTLASAAVAIAAAASVAKAAAAAASVASNAALQAKLMAEEALSPNGNSQISNDGFSLSALGVTKSSSSIIVAAKEAARRRIEAASAASLRAENLDAIVKAAELAAEAITQAGKVVTMGDSLPISQLIEAGPDGFWKMPQVSSNHGAELHDGNREQSNNNNTYSKPGASGKQLAGPVQDKGTSGTQHALPPTSGESLGDKSEKHGSLTDGVSSLVNSDGKNFRGLKGRKASDLAGTTAGGNHVSAVSHEEFDETSRKSKESGIAVGSQVEVFKDGDGYKAAWFSANVLSLKDGKVYLCYSEIASNEGTGKLKEWVELGSEVDKAPRVRIAHPMTALKSEGTRKRRRAAVGDFLCSVGDKVDAWMRDCWWEGEVAEKSKRDGTSVTVHFPAHGETSVIRTWQLRPSLMWKDGEWIEWSSMRENVQTHQEGDMPQEKRARLGTPGLESKGKDKVQESVQVVEPGNHQVVESLDLTAKEKTFDIGKKNTIESRIDRLKSARTGLRKEGSRVVIGVPKPGKKRKFMEVSKHYVGNQKTEELNDSVKLANYLMPLRSGPRGWKNFSKDDTKEKRMVESKPKILRSGRSQNVSSRTIPQKNNLTTAGSSYGALAGIKSKDSSDHDHDENASEKHNSAEHGSFSNSEGVTEGPISSLIPSSDASSLKRTFIASAKAERANKGKVPGGKVATHEDKSFSRNATNAASEAVEPRRSNRRIQPTSRLLEGLQSSMIITKMPSTSHDRGHRIQRNDRG